jgi:hypothetical protein
MPDELLSASFNVLVLEAKEKDASPYFLFFSSLRIC